MQADVVWATQYLHEPEGRARRAACADVRPPCASRVAFPCPDHNSPLYPALAAVGRPWCARKSTEMSFDIGYGREPAKNGQELRDPNRSDSRSMPIRATGGCWRAGRRWMLARGPPASAHAPFMHYGRGLDRRGYGGCSSCDAMLVQVEILEHPSRSVRASISPRLLACA